MIVGYARISTMEHVAGLAKVGFAPSNSVVKSKESSS
jgi:hypothetical protein